jgi:hypothetical protein
MDTYERRALIEELQEKSAEGRAEIERKQAEREADPIAYDNWIRAEATLPELPEFVTKTNENGLVTPAPEPQPELAFTDEQADAIGYVVAAERKRERKELEKSLAPMRERIAHLEGKVEMLLQLLQQTKITDARH